MKKKKRSRVVYDDAVKIENIYNMWHIIKKTCKNKKELFHFSLNLTTNIDYIYRVLKNKTYTPSKYKTFMIFEPKPRLVMSQSIRDKIINHFVANYYLIPYLESSLIDVNVATRKEKGSSYAMKLIKKYFNRLLINNKYDEIYCLKIDISKYFYSIYHNILLKKLEKRIYDKDIINLIKNIISQTNNSYINDSIRYYNTIFKTSIPLYTKDRGLSIGAMSSQFLAIFYLNDLDHYIKEKLKCKYYIRYMDDFIILEKDKEKLKYIWRCIEKEVRSLNLSMNNKSNIFRCSKGFTFLGYKYKTDNGKLNVTFNKKTFYKIKRKLKNIYMLDKVKFNRSLASYWGYFNNGFSLKKGDFKMKVLDVYNSFKEKYSDSLIIVKDGIFYKTYYNDAKVLWYLFEYKYVKDSVSFGNVPYDKVISKLKKLDVNFVVISSGKETLMSIMEDSSYNLYLDLAIRLYDKKFKISKLLSKLEHILDEHYDCYGEIDLLLDKYNV